MTSSSSSGESDIWQLNDQDLGALASVKLRNVEGRGKADIGGRLRVAAILRSAGISASSPERIAGSTNEVWRAGEYIIRVSNVPGSSRLRREASLVKLLPWGTNYPTVVASGEEPFGEWLVVRHQRGLPLSEAWMNLERLQRRSIVHEIGRTIKEVHSVVVPEDLAAGFSLDARSAATVPHHLDPAKLMRCLDRASSMPYVDPGLIAALIEKLEAVSDVFDGDAEFGLVHGDLHFENVLVLDGVLVALLDFEWCRPGPREIDLDVLARFCAHPDLTVHAASKAQRDSYRPVLGWLHEVYPEWFQAPRLTDRLMYCSLAAEVPFLMQMPPTAPAADLPQFHPVNRLRELLEHGSTAERLGWAATSF